ncbi:efflux RND transporter periplasmic adaptor subunit [Pedobacter chinensis]|uniref:Efflux RND transporter periplasmic adaptor subunit n=1 Tax=Pedobacter chinensis TaxID=2282421 RepID=A0A369PXQ3_9SPHI|nr:efflux RND transporter periplasmic adaptor subunit [Pedobacter chinensis]RDC55995.1 efflux RND transporter periplasmic adaptor subunit [Pedobacter chinensis]
MKNKLNVGIICMAVLMACGNPENQKDISVDQAVTVNTNEVQLSAEQVRNADIRTGKIETKRMYNTINVNGVVDVPPENTYSVSVPMGGYIRKMLLIPGMMVKKGAVLTTVEDQQYIQLQQDYLTSKNKLKFVAEDYIRQKGLNQTKATSDKIFQQTESEFNNQKVLVKSLAEKLRLIGINPLTLNEDNITRSISIYAPISGYVTKVNVNAGKYVNAADVLFELISPGALHASLTVFERDAASLKIGQEIVCTTSANPEKKYIAKIHLITPNIEGDRTTTVHCDLENAGNKLLPGTFLNAAISVSNAVVDAVPEDAVVKWENKYYVFEDLGSYRYKMIPVEIGTAMEGFTEIKTKSRPGNIVTKNAYAILMKMKNSGEEGE